VLNGSMSRASLRQLVASACACDSLFKLALSGTRCGSSTLLSFAHGSVACRYPRSGYNPCCVQASTVPPGCQPPTPGSEVHRSFPLPGLASGRTVVAQVFLLRVALTLTGYRPMTSAIHLLSIHSRRVKSATYSGLHVTPGRFRLHQCPLTTTVRLLRPSRLARHRDRFCSPEPGCRFTRFSRGSPAVCFSLAGVSEVFVGLADIAFDRSGRCRPAAS